MVNRMQFYIDGDWVDPVVKKSTPVVNPATEEAMYEVALGSKADVDKAVAAARRAFETYSQTSREERVALLARIIEVYKTRMKDIGAAVSDEMGAPLPMAEKLQAGAGLGHLASTLEILKNYQFDEPVGSAMVVREPVGVIGMITPWNWPLNQIACKVAPALAAGCTMILKPSEFTPSSALIFAELLHEAGDPRAEGTTIGPVVSRIQWDKIQKLIQKGIEEGATLVAGGPGLPEGVNKGFYVRPTIFADVTNDMTIAREEIFGPVLTILGAKDEADAVKIANDTPYGLAGYVTAGTVERARKVGRQIRAGNVNLQGMPNDRTAPFGGYKQSGTGREWGRYGMDEDLEVKAIAGFNAA